MMMQSHVWGQPEYTWRLRLSHVHAHELQAAEPSHAACEQPVQSQHP